MVNNPVFAASFLAFSFVVFAISAVAATPASCTDGNGKLVPAEKCAATSRNIETVSDNVPGFPARKKLILKNMRHAERVIKTAISCAEKARTDSALQACAQ